MNTKSLKSSDFTNEINNNILPFWSKYSLDKINGGFYGALTNNLQIHNEIPRSAILCARILWSFAAAYRKFGQEAYLDSANFMYDYLISAFWDTQYEGIYWDVDKHGQAVTDRKHHYAQAFAIYSLGEYSLASGNQESLQYAKKLYHLIEKHAYDPAYQGYIEGSNRDWTALEDMRLSDKDMNCRKSMNTMLHMLESYSGLVQVWPESEAFTQLKSMIEVFIEHIINPDSGHLRLFFDDQWHSLNNTLSFGHDIECSWLLWEAAQAMGDKQLSERAYEAVLKLAYAVLRDGMDKDGSVFQEFGPQGINHLDKEWWTQAEAVVGFYNAYQLCGNDKFLHAAEGCWAYIQNNLIDHQYGGWIKRIRPDGTPNHKSFKIGPWECPYHHTRLCLEMIERLNE